MTASWPADLPQYVQANSSETLPNETIESQVANGPPQFRRRIRGLVREFTLSIHCTPDQSKIFEEFYRDTLSGGVLPFSWVNPRTQAGGLFRFKGPPPRYQVTPTGASVIVAFQLCQVG